MPIELITPVVFIAAGLAFFDAAIGMGYGTSIIAVLLLLGFPPLEAVPAVLFTNAILGLISGVSHHKFDNVNFSKGSKDLKVMLALTGIGIIGVLFAIYVAINIPEKFLKAYIGILVFFIGSTIILKHKGRHKFSWRKILTLGCIAAFNKGLSGGAYGPVLVGGQILSGVPSTRAVGIASLTEGLISIVGAAAYFAIEGGDLLNWSLIVSLMIGGTVTVPFAAYVVQKYHPHQLRSIIGIVSIALGASLLTQIFV